MLAWQPSIMSLIIIRKRIGLMTEPCGTPLSTLYSSECVPFIRTLMVLFDKNCCMNIRRFPFKPSLMALLTRTLWQTESKACVISMNAARVDFSF